MQCSRWFILSARHGVIDPTTIVEPRDEALDSASRQRRRAWSRQVLAQLADELGDLGQYEFELHAGAPYRDFGLADGLRAAGATILNPTEGLGFGYQFAFCRGPRVTDEAPLATASVSHVDQIGAFDFRWPDATEHFESGWTCRLTVRGEQHRVRHGLGGREVYGRERVHTVTWLDGEVQVEGVEADDYPGSGCLVSLLRHSDKTMIRDLADVPADYDGFDVVDHRREIDAKWSRNGLAVKIVDGDLVAWGVHAWLRRRSRGAPAIRVPRPASRAESFLPPAPTLEKRAVVEALIAHGRRLAESLGGGAARFAVDDAANTMIHADPFAFLVAVIADQGIKAERAWAIPYELKLRLGQFSPEILASDRERVRKVFAESPKLHRFVNQVTDWIVAGAEIVLAEYGGDAAAIWSGNPTAADLRARFDAFPGIGQKKAAMAVEILERDLGVSIADLSGSDVAFDIHLRRVFLRTGIADRDDMGHMVRAARSLHPERPGELDNPAWDVGRRWCTAGTPVCSSCPLVAVCPRLIERGSRVRGI
ncbi:MAG: hypothetical protein AMXMBFR46_00590 [Acidimicrobiia bacterium]